MVIQIYTNTWVSQKFVEEWDNNSFKVLAHKILVDYKKENILYNDRILIGNC